MSLLDRVLAPIRRLVGGADAESEAADGTAAATGAGDVPGAALKCGVCGTEAAAGTEACPLCGARDLAPIEGDEGTAAPAPSGARAESSESPAGASAGATGADDGEGTHGPTPDSSGPGTGNGAAGTGEGEGDGLDPERVRRARSTESDDEAVDRLRDLRRAADETDGGDRGEG